MKHLSVLSHQCFLNSLLSREICMTSLSLTLVHLPFQSSVVSTQLTWILGSSRFSEQIRPHSLQSSNAYEYVSSAPLLPGLGSEVLGSSQENRPLGITLQGSGVCSCCGYLGSVWTFFLSVWLVHPVCWAYASYMFWEKVSDWRPYYDLKSWKVCMYEFCISQTTIFDSETGYLETLSRGFGCLRHSL